MCFNDGLCCLPRCKADHADPVEFRSRRDRESTTPVCSRRKVIKSISFRLAYGIAYFALRKLTPKGPAQVMPKTHRRNAQRFTTVHHETSDALIPAAVKDDTSHADGCSQGYCYIHMAFTSPCDCLPSAAEIATRQVRSILRRLWLGVAVTAKHALHPRSSVFWPASGNALQDTGQFTRLLNCCSIERDSRRLNRAACSNDCGAQCDPAM